MLVVDCKKSCGGGAGSEASDTSRDAGGAGRGAGAREDHEFWRPGGIPIGARDQGASRPTTVCTSSSGGSAARSGDFEERAGSGYLGSGARDEILGGSPNHGAGALDGAGTEKRHGISFGAIAMVSPSFQSSGELRSRSPSGSGGSGGTVGTMLGRGVGTARSGKSGSLFTGTKV
jgi:hypothetical protein